MLGISKRSARLLTMAAAGLASIALARDVLRRRRQLDIQGRVAVITGGSRGLGLLLSEELGRRGARVAICGRDPEALARARQRLEALGVEVHAVACDLGVRQEAEAFIDSVVAAFGGIDMLINNAGSIQVAPLQDLGIEGLEASMRSNFWSAAYVTLRALPHLTAPRSGGRIVNITSIGGRVAVPHLMGYAASKFAMVGFSEGLHAELARAGVRVTTVIPGLMRTGSIYNASFGGEAEREFAWFGVSASVPLLSMNARRAARRVVRAALEGRAELRLGITARAASLVHGVAPALLARLMGLAGRLLPKATGRPPGPRGRDLRSPLSGSMLLRLSDQAARLNNEAPPAAARS
jgi:NAD(P)-dependent dehydrogenase (short-subunit alcohol dehydrogenase family)